MSVGQRVRVLAGWSTLFGHVGVVTRHAVMPAHVMVLFDGDPREACFAERELEVVDAS